MIQLNVVIAFAPSDSYTVVYGKHVQVFGFDAQSACTVSRNDTKE